MGGLEQFSVSPLVLGLGLKGLGPGLDNNIKGVNSDLCEIL